MSVIYFLSFANETFARALGRISQEARDSGIFKDVFAMEPKDLSPDFVASHASLLRHKRGYGYGCWKFHIILETFKKIPEGAWVFYIDAGCTLIKDRAQRAIDEIKDADAAGKDIIVYQMPGHLERKWTKASLFKHLGVLDDPAITNTGQYLSGIVRVKNTHFSRDIFGYMLELSGTHPEFFDDSHSSITNYPEFSEHRHNQSVVSILCKIHAGHVHSIGQDETYNGPAFVQATRRKS